MDRTPDGLEGPTVSGETVDYPKGDFGYEVGEVLPNQAFLGYAHVDPTTTIDTTVDEVGRVRFSDYYDPRGERGLSYLVIDVQAAWCWVSDHQEDATNGSNYSGSNTGHDDFATQYAADGVRFMTLLIEGPVEGQDATLLDLRNWTLHHEARTSQALLTHDELSLDVIGYAWPYTMIVDLRTMRVVSRWVGWDETNATLNALIRSRVRGVANH